MRIIDADVLPEHKFVGNKFTQIGGRRNGKMLEVVNQVYQLGWNDAIDAIVDNAPTVEITDYDTGYQDGLEDGLNDIRPTGEWKYNGFCVTTPQYKCSVCGMHSLDRSKFCPNCGADMRKEEE